MQRAFFDILKVIYIKRLSLVTIVLILNQLPILDLEEGLDLKTFHLFGDPFPEEVALLVAGAVALTGMDGMLVLVKLIEGEGECALTGASVVPVLEEGFSAAGD